MLSRRRLILPFIAPALVLYVLFYIGPSLASAWISLHAWSGVGDPMVWAGMSQYRRMLSDPIFIRSFTNTLKVLFIVGGSVFFFSFLFTVILREFGPRHRKFIRAVLFFPNIVAPVALAIAWGFMLNPTFGLVNDGLRQMGLGAWTREWLAPELIFPAIMAALVWVYTGFFATIIFAGVDRIPQYYYEAFELEGGGGIRKFFKVTLPMSWDVVSVAAVLWVIAAVKIFEFIYAFGGVGDSPPTTTWTSALHMYIVSLGSRTPIYQMGYGSAIAVAMVALIALLVILLRRLMRRDLIEF